MSVLTTLLFYWRVLPPIVRGMAWLLERTLGVGGAVGLSTAANIFLGMVEAPLFIRPYLAQLTRSELFLVMTGGMAGIAGTVLVLYATFLAPLIPDAAAHFVIASVLGAPAAILVSLIMVPETSDKRTGGSIRGSRHASVLAPWTRSPRAPRPGSTAAQHHRDAAGAGGAGLSRQCHPRPVARDRRRQNFAAAAAGLPDGAGVLADGPAMAAGDHGRQPDGHQDRPQRADRLSRACRKLGTDALDPRSRLIMLYAMCGFANFASLGIMIGGLGTMAPQRREEINALGLKSIVSGTLTDVFDGRDRGGDDISAVIRGGAQHLTRNPLSRQRTVIGWIPVRATRAPE
jgi:CNT family concentrative nucleoside transporter